MDNGGFLPLGSLGFSPCLPSLPPLTLFRSDHCGSDCRSLSVSGLLLSSLLATTWKHVMVLQLMGRELWDVLSSTSHSVGPLQSTLKAQDVGATRQEGPGP